MFAKQQDVQENQQTMLCPDSGASYFNDAFVKMQRNVQSLCERDQ